jgi:hypothetical protein
MTKVTATDISVSYDHTVANAAGSFLYIANNAYITFDMTLSTITCSSTAYVEGTLQALVTGSGYSQPSAVHIVGQTASVP